MVLDFRNINTVWASVLAETLSRLGLQTAIICPGSRSAPLAVAFAQHPTLEAIPILDERSAAFFALGLARRSGTPVVLVCTSGTAGANFYPAVIEAHESRVPLIVLTADRPPELRNCHAGQAINQVQLYGGYARWFVECALPAVDISLLAYLRQTLIQAWERSQWPCPGPVHLNLPFRDPLAPTPETGLAIIAQTFDSVQFFQSVQPLQGIGREEVPLPLAVWEACDRGLIVAGPAAPLDNRAYCQAVGQLSQTLGWPVLAEALSPLRNHADLNPYLVSTYDIALRNRDLAAQLEPQHILRVGELPTSKTLRQWLQTLNAPHWILAPAPENVDPLHSRAIHVRSSVETVARCLRGNPSSVGSPSTPYLNAWLTVETQLRCAIRDTFQSTEALHESKVAWLLSQHLPLHTPLFIANSMPVRDMEWFWQPGNTQIQPYCNRGANGIDGTLSTALGMAHRDRPSVLLTGDLSLLHDTNGFLIQPHWQGHLTLVLINNQGGGIFGMLPIADFEPPFETYFATPQLADFALLCAAYQVEYQRVGSWADLIAPLNPLPKHGIRVLEVGCDRHRDAQWRKTTLERLSACIQL